MGFRNGFCEWSIMLFFNSYRHDVNLDFGIILTVGSIQFCSHGTVQAIEC
jgi:hypothetical protein